MKRFLQIGAAVVLCLSIGSADAWFRRGGGDRELPIVADGLTVTDHIGLGMGNNIDRSAQLTSAISTSNGSPTVTIAQASHGLTAGTDRVNFYNSTTVGGLNIDGGWMVASTPTSGTFTITHTSNANATVGPTGNTIITNPSVWHEDGKFRFLCNFSHLNYDDPILFPGVPGATHLHLFFGNRSANYASTYASLRASGDGTCDGGPLNRSAYWMPAMIDTNLNQVRIPQDFQWYYVVYRSWLIEQVSPVCVSQGGSGLLSDGRAAACPQMPVKKLERGIRAVYGFKTSAGSLPYGTAGAAMLDGAWSCHTTGGGQQGGLYRYLHHRTTSALGLSSNVSCPTNGQVQLRIVSPSCWNGSHGDVNVSGNDGFNHFAFPSSDGWGNVCPATHPNKFIEFTVIATWNYTGGISQLSDWQLSSDRFNGANFEAGETVHWDHLWAWNDSVQDHWGKFVMGMWPSPASSTAAGGPYIYNNIGSGFEAGSHINLDAHFVGGPFMRNENDGGLSGNAGIGDCAPLGLVGGCSLKSHTLYGGGGDMNVAIPTAPLGTYTIP